jgi:hypothetical protein
MRKSHPSAIGQFYAIVVRWLGLYYILIPVISFLLLPVLLQVGGPQGFLDVRCRPALFYDEVAKVVQVCAAMQYGLMETVFLLGRAYLACFVVQSFNWRRHSASASAARLQPQWGQRSLRGLRRCTHGGMFHSFRCLGSSSNHLV